MGVQVKEVKKKINRGQVATLSAIIGKCAIKSVGSALFVPMIKLKAACTGSLTETQELFKQLRQEIGFNPEPGTPIPFAVRQEMAEKEEALYQDEVKNFTETHLLTAEQFASFHEENPTLTTAELEFLLEWLVKA